MGNRKTGPDRRGLKRECRQPRWHLPGDPAAMGEDSHRGAGKTNIELVRGPPFVCLGPTRSASVLLWELHAPLKVWADISNRLFAPIVLKGFILKLR